MAAKKKIVCPIGHSIPHRTKRGECTPLYCAEETKMVRAKPAPEAPVVALAPPGPISGAVDPEALAEANAKVAQRRAHHEAWKEIIPVPSLKGAEAEKWADEKLTELLPAAVADLERDLKFGSDEQRARARDKILDATGRGKQEKAAGAGQQIIINLGGDASKALPWAQRVANGVKNDA